jgi:hypothetical protein
MGSYNWSNASEFLKKIPKEDCYEAYEGPSLPLSYPDFQLPIAYVAGGRTIDNDDPPRIDLLLRSLVRAD